MMQRKISLDNPRNVWTALDLGFIPPAHPDRAMSDCDVFHRKRASTRAEERKFLQRDNFLGRSTRIPTPPPPDGKLPQTRANAKRKRLSELNRLARSRTICHKIANLGAPHYRIPFTEKHLPKTEFQLAAINLPVCVKRDGDDDVGHRLHSPDAEVVSLGFYAAAEKSLKPLSLPLGARKS